MGKSIIEKGKLLFKDATTEGKNVNDGDFLKYIPDSLLTNEQI